MTAFSLLLNILWILFGGLWMAAGWALAGVIMAITIIGLPWTGVAFKFALYALVPFGRHAVPDHDLTADGRSDRGALSMIRNLVWLLLAGWWLALGHVLTAIPWAIIIIGIPFAWAHLKLAGLALWPVGKTIVTSEDVDTVRRFRFVDRVRGRGGHG